MKRIAKRLQTVNEYYFSRKLREVQQLIARGKPIVNMGVGSPDLAPHSSVIEAIQKAMFDSKAHDTRIIRVCQNCARRWIDSIVQIMVFQTKCLWSFCL